MQSSDELITDAQASNERMMTRVEAAEYLGLKPATLEAWASRGNMNLPLSKLGRCVRYRKRDLDGFIASTRSTETGKRSPASA